MRWVGPLFMFLVTGWVAWYNANHSDRAIIFPFIDVMFPEDANDPIAMGQKSVVILIGISSAVLLLSIVDQVRAIVRWRRRRSEEQGEG